MALLGDSYQVPLYKAQLSFLGFVMSGWMPATMAKGKAKSGLRPRWTGLPRSFSILRSPAISGFPRELSPTGRRLLRSCLLQVFTSYLSLWIIERTFSWLGQNRRLSKDYEQRYESEEAWIYVAMTRLMTKRLAAA
jgi:transposase